MKPILRQAGLSAHANIYSPFDLKPWDEETAATCLGELANSYCLDLPLPVRLEMCRKLRCQISPPCAAILRQTFTKICAAPARSEATMTDVERVYTTEMLAVRGQMDLDHYESRLKMVLGREVYGIALEILTEAAVDDGQLSSDVVDRYREYFQGRAQAETEADPVPIEDVLYVLEHDGYLERQGDGYRFVSGLLEDWWRARHSRHFVPIKLR